MKHTCILLFTVAMFIGCSHSDPNNFKEKLQGDWITLKSNSEANEHTNCWGCYPLFSFEDDQCIYISADDKYSSYSIEKDTLIIKVGWNSSNGSSKFLKLYIQNITKNELTLIPSDETKKYFRDHIRKIGYDEFQLEKVRMKTTIPFERIGFYSTACLGKCPKMYMEIDSDGNILFDGKIYTDKKGLHKGTISSRELMLLKQKYSAISIENLKKVYTSNVDCVSTLGMMIKANDRIYSTRIEGDNEVPTEVKLLVSKLMGLYRNATLTQDSTVSGQFQFKEFMKGGVGE